MSKILRVWINKENRFSRNHKSFGLPLPSALQNSQLSTDAPKLPRGASEGADKCANEGVVGVSKEC